MCYYVCTWCSCVTVVYSLQGKKEVAELKCDLTTLTVGECIGILCTPLGGLKLYVNGLPAAHLTNCVPSKRRAIVDIHGSVISVKVSPMRTTLDTTVLQMGGLPEEAPLSSTKCQYFQACRRFLSAQRHVLSGTCIIIQCRG